MTTTTVALPTLNDRAQRRELSTMAWEVFNCALGKIPPHLHHCLLAHIVVDLCDHDDPVLLIALMQSIHEATLQLEILP